MFIQTQSTPNPSSLMFYPGKLVKEVGSADFPNARSAMNSPLARAIYAIDSKFAYLSDQWLENHLGLVQGKDIQNLNAYPVFENGGIDSGKEMTREVSSTAEKKRSDKGHVRSKMRSKDRKAVPVLEDFEELRYDRLGGSKRHVNFSNSGHFDKKLTKVPLPKERKNKGIMQIPRQQKVIPLFQSNCKAKIILEKRRVASQWNGYECDDNSSSSDSFEFLWKDAAGVHDVGEC
ncbi:hypothetical protein LWI28_001380 [Acer negundo]|uniref:Scaffold protein Nfu/NifU N-terminal domain-containing protein n=1 Tax=Acer negundo TaxID=4023 RepID=A0AAD5IH14_ACENE|nr:hypothetical protein LWI28_001380 [Acer negundo]